MTQLPSAIVLDLTYDNLLAQVQELQVQRNLNNCEMELILIKVLNAIREKKEKDFAGKIVDLVYQIQQMEQKSDEPEIEVLNEVKGSNSEIPE